MDFSNFYVDLQNFQAPLLVFDIVFFVLCGNVKHFYFHCRSLYISIVYRFVFPLCIALYVLSAISRIHCRIHSKSFRLFRGKKLNILDYKNLVEEGEKKGGE